jgi:hypothetical protein
VKINVLGTEYLIVNDNTGKNHKLKKANGYCETYSKKIVLETAEEFENDPDNVENYEYFKAKVLRHEIVHAFLHESGLDSQSDWARNEEIVDWIAFQVPKMFKVMIESQCLLGGDISNG